MPFLLDNIVDEGLMADERDPIGMRLDFRNEEYFALNESGVLQEYRLEDLFDITTAPNQWCWGRNGKLRLGPHNLVTHSNDFSAAPWIKIRATVTEDLVKKPHKRWRKVWRVMEQAAGDYTALHTGSAVSIVGGRKLTVSMVLSPIKSEHFRVRLSTDVGYFGAVHFSVISGKIAIVSSDNATGGCFPLSNGMYFVWATGLAQPAATNSTGSGIFFKDSAGSSGWYTGRPDYGWYIEHFQVEQADTYGSQVDTNGAVKWGPVIDRTALGTTVRGLRRFGPYKNLIGYASDFANAYWSWSNGTWEATTIDSPIEGRKWHKLTPNSGETGIVWSQNIAKPSVNRRYSFGLIVKGGGAEGVSLTLDGGDLNSRSRINFNLSNGTSAVLDQGGFSGTTVYIEDLGDGAHWIHGSAVSGTESIIRMRFFQWGASGGRDLLLQGAYIYEYSRRPWMDTGDPATTVATVFEDMDIKPDVFSRVWNPAEGTMQTVSSVDRVNADGGVGIMTAYGATDAERIKIALRADAKMAVHIYEGNGTGPIMNAPIGSPLTSGQRVGMVLGYREDGYLRFGLTGVQSASDTSTLESLPSVSGLNLGGGGPSDSPLYGYIENATVYRSLMSRLTMVAAVNKID